jgi:hypothetical protein
MYDDHKKHGCLVPTKPKFGGYYALLKLDKHPKYKGDVCFNVMTFLENKRLLIAMFINTLLIYLGGHYTFTP